jgi:hypothetical protein
MRELLRVETDAVSTVSSFVEENRSYRVGHLLNRGSFSLAGGSLLHFAIRTGDLPLTLLLLTIAETDLHKRDYWMRDPLYYASSDFLLVLLQQAQAKGRLAELLQQAPASCARLVRLALERKDVDAISLIVENATLFPRV